MRRKAWFFVWGLVIFIGCTYAFMLAFVNPIIGDYSRAKIEAMTIKAVNRAISNVVHLGTYKQLTDVRYDTNGRITSLTANMMQMNGLSSDIALAAQGHLELFASEGIAVPIGTFSGLPILTGKGPNANLRVVPIGAVNCSFDSRFSSVGINQTRHTIKLRVKTIVNIIMPLGSRNVDVEIEVLLCESIIIGEVPEWMFQG